jgi:hypothetical protein
MPDTQGKFMQQIHVAKNGQKYGPYSEDDISKFIAQGRFSPSDLAWRDGCADWVPLSSLISGLLPPLPPPFKSSPLGTSSFVIGLVGAVFWVIIFIIAGIGTTHGYGSTSGLMITVGLLLFVGLGVNIVATILGIIAVNKITHNKTLSILGISINSFEFIGVLALILIGLNSK